MSPTLPAPSRPGGAPYRIAVVCLGNVCRSPMADVVLNDRLMAAGLADAVEVVSAGTGGWHVGGPMDERAAVGPSTPVTADALVAALAETLRPAGTGG
jgi:protein-tyrosine phosphatase